MRQLSHIVLRNSAFGMAAQLLIKLLSFAFTVLIVRRLGSAAFGQYTAVLAFGMSFAFLSDLGLSTYAVREVARLRDQPNGSDQINALYSTMLRLRLSLTVIAAILLVGAGWLVGYSPAMIGALALGAIGLFTYSVQGTCEALLAGHERLDLAAGAKVVAQLTFVCLGTVALVLHSGYYGLIIANQIGIALMTYVCWRAARSLGIRVVPIRSIPWRALLRSSLPFGTIAFTLGLSYKFDTILLSIFRSDAETGYYNAAYSLVFATVVLSNAINTALYPSLTRQSVADPSRLGAIYERALRYLLLAALPVALGGSLLADQIVALLYGAAYAPAAAALRLIIWVVPLMFASEFLGYVVLIGGHEKQAARSVLVSTALNVGFNLVLIPRYGLIGAATMTVVTEAILVMQYIVLLRSTLHTLDWQTALVRPLLATIGMGAPVLVIRSTSPVLLTIAIGALIYAALLLVLGVIGRDEWRFLRSLRAPAEVAP